MKTMTITEGGNRFRVTFTEEGEATDIVAKEITKCDTMSDALMADLSAAVLSLGGTTPQ
jgi:hypothetical protein